jgi:predicted nucleic acid-binding protein
MACLDTSFLIDLIRTGASNRRRRATNELRELLANGELLTTTRFNVAELLVGVYSSDDPDQEIKIVSAALQKLTILEFGPDSALLFGRITALLGRQGKPAGDMDVLIAATALVAGESLVTANPAHFRNIPGLTVQVY